MSARTLLRLLWLAGVIVGKLRAARARTRHYRRIHHPHQMRGRGLRMTETLRDLLRPAWLRLRR